MWFPFHRTPDPRGDAPANPTPIEILINTIADYISPRAREERHLKRVGNPAERQTEHRRIEREAAHYRRGFPVAGHGEPGERPRQRQRMRF